MHQNFFPMHFSLSCRDFFHMAEILFQHDDKFIATESGHGIAFAEYSQQTVLLPVATTDRLYHDRWQFSVLKLSRSINSSAALAAAFTARHGQMQPILQQAPVR